MSKKEAGVDFFFAQKYKKYDILYLVGDINGIR